MARDFKVRPTVEGAPLALSSEVPAAGYMPSLYRKMVEIIASTSFSGYLSVGIVTTNSTNGANTGASDADGGWLRQATAATINTFVGVWSNSLAAVMAAWDAEFVARIKMDATITSLRFWLGFFSVDPSLISNPTTQSVAAFRYDTSVDGTAFWRCVTAGGSAATVTVTTVAVTASTAYNMRITVSTGNVKFYINDVLVATHTTNTPAATAGMGIHCRLTTLTAAIRAILVSRISVSHK